jgi:acyl carrier protein
MAISVLPSSFADAPASLAAGADQLAELEAALVAYPGVDQACVLRSTAEDGSSQLIAYLATGTSGTLSVAPLAAYVERVVTASDYPATYLQCEVFPLQTNGEVDTQRLPLEAGQARASSEPASRAPANVIEARVLEAVRDTVGIDTVTLEDNFFAVGGHSLLGTQFVMRARKLFNVKVTLRDVFEADTVAELAERIGALIEASVDALSEQEASRLSTGHAA